MSGLKKIVTGPANAVPTSIMTSEILLIQVGLVLSVFLFTTSLNLIVLWYLAGIYLVLLGLLLFLDDGDIFVGFLWVIDLGVGLIFFIFILHYSVFLHQKSVIDKNSREVTAITFFALFIYSFYSYWLTPVDLDSTTGFQKTWIFWVSWLDYYLLFNSRLVTDLNLLHEIYFVNNNFEFILINFFLFYGIISAILLSFLIKYVFSRLALPQIDNFRLLNIPTTLGFIRNQDFIKQQSTSAGERVWVKTRFNSKSGF